MSEIHTLIAKLRPLIGVLKKQHENTHFKYKFRSVEDVLGVFSPALDACGLVPMVHVTDHKTWVVTAENKKPKHCASLMLTIILKAPDGSEWTSSAPGEGVDEGGDKATYKAMSGAFKYALLLGLCIPVDKRQLADPDRTPKAAGAPVGEPDPSAPTQSLFDRTVIAIGNAPDAKTLAKYEERVKQYIANGTFTPQEAKVITGTISARREDL